MESTTSADVKIAGQKIPLVAVLAHEFGHAYDTFLGFHFIYDKTKARTEDGEDRWIGNQEETISIIYENIMRAKYKIEGRKEYYGKSTYKKL